MGKKVRVSKNKKKNWNKVCDIKDVEDYLEEKRLEERIGGSVFEKTDDQLFVIQADTKDDAVLKKAEKPLRCFSNIGSFTKVPPPIIISQKPYSKKIENNLTKVIDRRSKRVAKASQLKKVNPNKIVQKGDFFAAEIKDLWADEAKSIDSEIEDLIKFRDEYTCKRTPKVPEHRYQKPSLLPAVEVPHSGTSYNPDFFEHQDLLREALKVEECKQKEELHLKRVLTDMFPTKAEAPTQESIMLEMSQGLFEEGDPEEDSSQMETALHSYNPPVSHENRLPKAKKRRKKEMKERERLRKLEKLQKKRISEVYRINSLKNEIKKEAKEIKKKTERNLQKRAEKMFKPRTLSKYKYETPDLELNLSEELGDSLRTMKPEGNLLEDRYKSLQKRNIIEPRVKQKFQRRYKLKVQVKRSHRDFK